tara:strand:- start:65 stop:460 length:396 start_codon:yes stop_codon:yes gene_type:complete
MELLKQYIKEITEDLKIDEINVKEVQMRTPGRKHFWVARMINHKIDLEKLLKQRKKIEKELQTQVLACSEINVSASAVKRKIEESEPIVEINDKIREHELIIELLEKTEKTFSSLSYDLKNIIEIVKMENT